MLKVNEIEKVLEDLKENEIISDYRISDCNMWAAIMFLYIRITYKGIAYGIRMNVELMLSLDYFKQHLFAEISKVQRQHLKKTLNLKL